MARNPTNLRRRRAAIRYDYISRLPNDLLITILSLLPIEEAARTSVLSPSWNHLWTYNQTLDINYENAPYLSSYIICRALGLHQAPKYREVQIKLSDWDEEAGRYVASWFGFAASKSVERLDLHLPIIFDPNYHETRLHLPDLNFSRMNSLKYLRLHSKTVANSNIEYILTNCPNLEELSLKGSYRIEILKVSSESLKKLEIINCCFSRKLQLYSKNLVSFKYLGPNINISFDHVPLLGELSFVDTYCQSLFKHKFIQFSPVLEQLEMVKLTMNYPWCDHFPIVPKLWSLRNLELDIKVWGYNQVFNLFLSLFEALLGLKKFKIHFFWPDNLKGYGGCNLISRDRKYFCLKVVDLVGFIGGVLDLEIADYFIRNVLSLETLSIRVCKEACMEDEEKIEAKEIAYDLE